MERSKLLSGVLLRFPVAQPGSLLARPGEVLGDLPGVGLATRCSRREGTLLVNAHTPRVKQSMCCTSRVLSCEKSQVVRCRLVHKLLRCSLPKFSCQTRTPEVGLTLVEQKAAGRRVLLPLRPVASRVQVTVRSRVSVQCGLCQTNSSS